MVLNIKNKTEIAKKMVLSHAVQNRSGYMDELKKYDPKIINQMESIDLLHRGKTLKSDVYSVTKPGDMCFKDVYSVTKLGDRYFKDVYGSFEYYLLRFKGLFKRK